MSTGLGGLVRQPLWRRWTLASLLGRLPLTMTLLALVLVGEQVAGSLAVGAQLAGVATITAGIAAPLRGRQLDSGDLRVGLRNAALLTAAVLAAQAAAMVLGAPLLVLFGLAAAQGVTSAALSGGFRALLVSVVSAADLPQANTLEAVLIEIAFVAGPSLAGILALVVGPVGVLLAMAAASVASALLTATLPPVSAHPEQAAAAPWRTAGAPAVYLLALAMGAALGLLESALPARSTELGMAAASAGPLLALTAGGSAVGGLLAAVRRDHRRYQARVAVGLLLAMGMLFGALAATGGRLSLGVLLFLAGAPIAPLNALGSLRLQDTIPASRLGEGFAVFTAMILVGAGIGQSITGQLLESVGAQALLAGAAVIPIAAGVVISAVVLLAKGRRPQLRRSPAGTTR
ncbi:MFS transporter [soil metagenome]